MARCASCSSITKCRNTRIRRCRRCGHPLVFDPPSDGFSDVRFVKAMDRISGHGQLVYTETQLRYAVSRPKTERAGVLARLRGRPRRPKFDTPSVSADDFRRRLDDWRTAGGTVVGTMLGPTEIARAPGRQPGLGIPDDVAAHGFERAVVVDTAETAVMLVANNAHVDLRCAVLSLDGYPESFFGELMELLNRNPALVVAVLHSARAEHIDLAQRLRSWFPGPGVRVLEVGLRPAQAVAGNLLATAQDKRRQPDLAMAANPALARLTEAERDWLAWGLTADLAGLPPRRVMGILTRVFAQLAMTDERAFADPTTAARARRDHHDHHDHHPSGDHAPDSAIGAGVIWMDGGGRLSSDDDRELGESELHDGFDAADFDGDG